MILDGKKVADELQKKLKEKISLLQGRKPSLTFFLIGSNPASYTYVQMKKKACSYVGITSHVHTLNSDISESALLKEISKENSNPNTDALLVQMPLPSHINAQKIMEHIDPKKDVDAFHPLNVGRMLMGKKGGFLPCTPLGILVLLQKYKIETKGKHAVIIGRSNIVGKPMAALLMQKETGCNATVTIAHNYTTNLKEISKSADILISAVGKPHFITEDMVKKGSVIIDVGINRISEKGLKKLVGDVDFEKVQPIVSAITPVPGGVGPMTVSMLLENTYQSYLQHKKSDFES